MSSWAKSANREGPEGYKFGDLTRTLITKLKGGAADVESKLPSRIARTVKRNEPGRQFTETLGVVPS